MRQRAPNKTILRIFKTLIISLLMLHTFSLEMHAQPFLNGGYIHLGNNASIAQDTHSSWKYINIKLGKYDSLFTTTTQPVTNINFTTSSYWMKTTFKNESVESQFFLECARPITNEVELYVINEQGELIQIQHSGDDIPYETRPVRHRRILFQVTVQPEEKVTFLVKMRSDGEVINAQMKLWKIEAFSAFSQRENQYLGLYYGLLGTVLIIFGFIAYALKQGVYTYYVLYIFSLIFMQSSLDGIAFQNFWPMLPWMANHSVLIFSSTSVWLMMLYAGKFLELQKMPKAYRITYYLMNVLVAICTFTAMTNGATYELTFPAINGVSLLVLIFIIIGIIWKGFAKQQINLLFALAFISVLIGGILFIAGNIGLYFNEFLSENAIKLGSAAEVIFLSMAMAGRYRQIQIEKEEAQKESYLHLEAINKITKNQKERLEKIVVRRTSEIRKANEQLEEKNKEIIDSINYAKRIQEAILPPLNTFSKTLPNSFITYLPKDIVAGDFYWMEQVENPENPNDQIILFAAADCTGHGVPGAMVSVVCSNALNRAVREYGLVKPNLILDKVAKLVEETFAKSDLEVKDGMDISLCAYHPDQKLLEWSGANNPLYIVTPEKAQIDVDREMVDETHLPNLFEIKADKQPIGMFSNRTPYTLHQIPLNEGDIFYSFTDGFADQFGGEKGKKYKTKKMKEFFRSIYDQPIAEQGNMIKKEFNDWRGRLEQIDDVCVIGVRV